MIYIYIYIARGARATSNGNYPERAVDNIPELCTHNWYRRKVIEPLLRIYFGAVIFTPTVVITPGKMWNERT